MRAAPNPLKLEGLKHVPAYLSHEQQKSLLDVLRRIVQQAPLFTPVMPRFGQPMSVRMTSCGEWGWYSDKSGYRYIPAHPVTNHPWPTIPDMLLKAWSELTQDPTPPDSALINYYDSKARMGLHQDRDEDDLSAPVLSLSLGDTATFRVGGLSRGEPTTSIKLHSGDAFILAGEGRLAFHGIDRILPDTSPLLAQGGRINITMRRVRKS
jgi:DNA oxidative demethylase